MPSPLIPLMAAIAVSAPSAVLAHDGHGLLGSHWHATDVLGFVAVLVIALVVSLWSRR
ncbi:MAG: hypothetical protein RLZZ22_1987 [Pseudomonadota bacterium]|jgi:hypothetical protein